MNIAPDMAMGLGDFQVLLSVALILGAYRTLTYGLGLSSTASQHCRHIISFFIPIQAAIPVLAAFVILFLMRHEDTLLAVQAKERP